MTTHARPAPVARCAGRARERGVSMLEVLIAVVLISIGMLGIAAMQVTGLKNNANANLRAHASLLAYEMLDRMRANVAEATAGDYDLAFDEAVPAEPDPAIRHEVDLAAWRDALADALPGGNGAIAVVGGVATVTVRWTEREFGNAAGRTLQYRMSSRL